MSVSVCMYVLSVVVVVLANSGRAATTTTTAPGSCLMKVYASSFHWRRPTLPTEPTYHRRQHQLMAFTYVGRLCLLNVFDTLGSTFLFIYLFIFSSSLHWFDWILAHGYTFEQTNVIFSRINSVLLHMQYVHTHAYIGVAYPNDVAWGMPCSTCIFFPMFSFYEQCLSAQTICLFGQCALAALSLLLR